MFAKLARFAGFSHRHTALPMPPHCNDNRREFGLTAVARRKLRRRLVCNWQPAPSTGRLECVWQTAPLDSAADEPGISLRFSRARRLRAA